MSSQTNKSLWAVSKTQGSCEEKQNPHHIYDKGESSVVHSTIPSK